MQFGTASQFDGFMVYGLNTEPAIIPLPDLPPGPLSGLTSATGKTADGFWLYVPTTGIYSVGVAPGGEYLDLRPVVRDDQGVFLAAGSYRVQIIQGSVAIAAVRS